MSTQQAVITGACGHPITLRFLEGERAELVIAYSTSTICNPCWAEALDASAYQSQDRASRALFRARRRAAAAI